MRILVLGGTKFLGRHVVDAALARGHDVTLFNRGQTSPELYPDVEKLKGDRDGELDALRGRAFDAVVDTSGYVPRIVQLTLDALGDVGHYTFVSTISVYGDLSTPPTPETPLAVLPEPSEAVAEHYGALKARCEETVRARFPEAFIPRPGLIVGPWDPTGRFTYWPARIAEGGRVLAPAPASAAAQIIDGRDLGAWIVAAAETGSSGTIDAIAPSTTIGAILEACVEETRSGAELTWVDSAFLVKQEVGGWMELPLWLGEEPGFEAMLQVPAEPALAAGLRPRPLADTIHDTLVWVASGEAPADPPAGLARDKEARVLAAWDART